jgi:hypothetical protein
VRLGNVTAVLSFFESSVWLLKIIEFIATRQRNSESGRVKWSEIQEIQRVEKTSEFGGITAKSFYTIWHSHIPNRDRVSSYFTVEPEGLDKANLWKAVFRHERSGERAVYWIAADKIRGIRRPKKRKPLLDKSSLEKIILQEEKTGPGEIIADIPSAEKEKVESEQEKINKQLDMICSQLPFLYRMDRILRWEERVESCRFRPEGPLWIDFEENRVYRRQAETATIIDGLLKQRIQVIIGHPASGKSVILRDVGYQLIPNGYGVLYTDVEKDTPDLNILTACLDSLDCPKCVLFVDNAHHNPTEVAKLMRLIDFKTSSLKLIVASRPYTKGFADKFALPHISQVEESGRPTFWSPYTPIPVSAEKVFEPIVRWFFGDAGFKEEFLSHLKPFRHDLLVLAVALDSYDFEKGVSWESIFANLKDRMQQMGKMEEGPYDASDVLLPLSVFYRFEIPIRQEFLTYTIGLSERGIVALMEEGTILERDGVLSLHHSSVASLYFETFKRYDFLGRVTKKKVMEETAFPFWWEGLFQLYLNSFPQQSCNVIGALGYKWDFIKNLGIRNFDNITTSIDSERDLGVIVVSILLIRRASRIILRRLLKRLNLEALMQKVEAEEGVVRSCLLIAGVNDVDAGLARALLSVVKNKMKKEEDLDNIILYSLGITRVITEELGDVLDFGITPVLTELVGVLNSRKIAKKIKASKGIEKALVISRISPLNQEFATSVVNHLCLSRLRKKMEVENNVAKIALCVLGVMDGDRDKARELVNKLDPRNLVRKIENERSITCISKCISVVHSASEEYGNRLLRDFGVAKTLLDKAKEESNVHKIGECILDLSIDRVTCTHLFRSLHTKILRCRIETEEDVENLDGCIRCVDRVSRRRARVLVDSLNMVNVMEKIRVIFARERIDIRCLTWLFTGSAEKIKELLPTIREWVETEDDIERLGTFLREAARFSHQSARELIRGPSVKKIVTRLLKENDIRTIGRFFHKIAETDGKIATSLLRSSESELTDKMKNEDCLEKVRYLLWSVRQFDRKILKRIVRRLTSYTNINRLKGIFEGENYFDDISYYFAIISCVNKRASKELAPVIRKKLLTTKDRENLACFFRDESTFNRSAARILWGTDDMQRLLVELSASKLPNVRRGALRLRAIVAGKTSKSRRNAF